MIRQIKKFIILILLIFTLSACGTQTAQNPEIIPQVQIQAVNYGVNGLSKQIIGTVKPINEVTIKSELSGRLNKINFAIGDQVTKDGNLAELGDSQGMDALFIQYLDSLKTYENTQDIDQNSDNLYNSNINATSDTLNNTYSVLNSTRSSIAMQTSLLEKQVQDSKIAFAKAVNDLDTARVTNKLELTQTENLQTQAKLNLDFAEQNLGDTKLKLEKADRDLEENTANTITTIYSTMTKTETEMDKIIGYSDSTSNDAYELAFGVSNSNLKNNVFLNYKTFNTDMKDFKVIYKDYQNGKYLQEEMLVYLGQYLSEQKNYLDKFYLLATDYTTAIGSTSQITVDALVNNIYSLVAGLATQKSTLNQIKQATEDLKLNHDSVLLATKNQYDQAKIVYENTNATLDMVKQKHQNQIATLEYALDIAKSNLEKAQTQLDKAKIDTDLQIKNISNNIDTLHNTIKTQQANKSLQSSQLEGQLDKANTQIELLKNQLDRRFVKSPINGIILQKFVETGNLVNPGEPLFSVGDLSQVKVIINVDQIFLSQLKIGAKADIYCEKCVKKNYQGQIINISDALDQVTKKGLVEVKISETGGELKSNMIVDIDFVGQSSAKIFIPLKNVKITDGQYSVFVYDHAIAREQPIEVGEISGDSVGVLSGLDLGDFLIISNTQDLKSGDKVEREKVKVKN